MAFDDILNYFKPSPNNGIPKTTNFSDLEKQWTDPNQPESNEPPIDRLFSMLGAPKAGTFDTKGKSLASSPKPHLTNEELNALARNLPEGITGDSPIAMPGHFGIPGDTSLASPPAGEIAEEGIPDLQKDGKSLQKASYKKSSVISDLTKQLARSPATEEPATPASTFLPPIPQADPLAVRQAEMDAALEDRRQNMNNSVLRGAATDFLNADRMSRGRDLLKPGYGDERLNAMSDLKLKDLDSKMKLAGAVGSEEKAKIDLSDMTAMSDPNSPGSQALRNSAAKFLGADKDPNMARMIAGMSGQQLQKLLGNDLAGILAKQSDQDLKREEMKMKQEQNGLDRDVKREAIAASVASRELKAQGKADGPDAYDKKLLEKYAESNVEWQTKDRPVMVENLEKVKTALALLDKNKKSFFDAPSGSIRGNTPDIIRNFTNPEAIQAKEGIQSAIQATLRPTLGAQFTENEGKRIMNLSFNDKLPPEENARRARELKKSIETKIKMTDELQQYVKRNKSDDGFNFAKYGMTKTGNSGSEFEADVLTYAQSHNITPEQAQAIKDKRSK